MPTLTKPQAVHALFKTRGRIFSATVRKRSNGELRNLNARLYRRKDDQEAYDTERLQVTVIDMQATRRERAKRYRTIALERVQRLACDGSVYDVV